MQMETAQVAIINEEAKVFDKTRDVVSNCEQIVGLAHYGTFSFFKSSDSGRK